MLHRYYHSGRWYYTNYSESEQGEKNVAGITKIGQHEVTEIKRDAAQVGCTKVTRAEVEELLKKMDSAPRQYDFDITDFSSSKAGSWEYLNFVIRKTFGGFVAIGADADTPRLGSGYSSESAHFCLQKKMAQKLFEFLGGALGHDSYIPERGSYNVLFQKV